MSTEMNHGKPGYTGIKRVIKATGYSIQGLKAAIKYEAAVRQELMLLIIFTPIALMLDVTVVEKILLIGVLVIVLLCELLNSAIEAIVDRVGTEYHELSGRAKDIGSASVFVALTFASFTWIGILFFS
ncbi:diacylglycerol kinase [Vibrio sp. MACH09]|nr:diacylglycerol kinase [Vibrio sp. MACH09]